MQNRTEPLRCSLTCTSNKSQLHVDVLRTVIVPLRMLFQVQSLFWATAKMIYGKQVCSVRWHSKIANMCFLVESPQWVNHCGKCICSQFQLCLKKISAFVTPDCFLEYTVMTFRTYNAPATFQRLVDTVLAGLPDCKVYIDNLIVNVSTWEQHVKTLSRFLSGYLVRPAIIFRLSFNLSLIY